MMNAVNNAIKPLTEGRVTEQPITPVGAEGVEEDLN